MCKTRPVFLQEHLHSPIPAQECSRRNTSAIWMMPAGLRMAGQVFGDRSTSESIAVSLAFNVPSRTFPHVTACQREREER